MRRKAAHSLQRRDKNSSKFQSNTCSKIAGRRGRGGEAHDGQQSSPFQVALFRFTVENEHGAPEGSMHVGGGVQGGGIQKKDGSPPRNRKEWV